ncbi:MAG: peptide chain release factor N(5)-glutamine methyltransferase [Gammaproteobacteria bacterium]|nr:peptide chain release factor N(5)-glutamine methyltransferase [Gammaproteobacteria bacterium]
MTRVASALSQAREQLTSHSESARLDAEILLANTLAQSRTWLFTRPEHELTHQQLGHFQKLIEQRQSGVPVAYLTGTRDFWNHSFQVTPQVLIPRPETEILVEHALQLIETHQFRTILELGTGSGAIAVSIADEKRDLTITATDISQQALNLAKANADMIGINNVRFIHSDWFVSLEHHHYDLIISNPPYIAQHDIHLNQGDIRFEPKQALSAGNDGLRDIRLIIDQSRNHLNTGGFVLLEHGYQQADAVRSLFSGYHYQAIETINDLQNHPRMSMAHYIQQTL